MRVRFEPFVGGRFIEVYDQASGEGFDVCGLGADNFPPPGLEPHLLGLSVCNQRRTQQVLEVRRDAPVRLELLVLPEPSLFPRRAADRADHQIACRVLEGDKLDDLRPVSHDAQHQRPEGVRQHVSPSLTEDAVAEDRAERRRGRAPGQLRL